MSRTLRCRACLRRLVHFEGGLACGVEVSSVTKRVVRADNHLPRSTPCNITQSFLNVHTASLLPGSFTVVNCSSLYFLNAGSSERTSFGANTLMSVVVS